MLERHIVFWFSLFFMPFLFPTPPPLSLSLSGLMPKVVAPPRSWQRPGGR